MITLSITPCQRGELMPYDPSFARMPPVSKRGPVPMSLFGEVGQTFAGRMTAAPPYTVVDIWVLTSFWPAEAGEAIEASPAGLVPPSMKSMAFGGTTTLVPSALMKVLLLTQENST